MATGAAYESEAPTLSAEDEDLLAGAESQEEREFLRQMLDFQEGLGGDYRIGLGDRLSVAFYGDPSIDRTIRVRPDGKISFPRVGDIPAAGFTPLELSGVISELYAEYLQNPEATVMVDEPGDQVVYVVGEVLQAGQFPIKNRITLSQAVADAGGWRSTAKLNSVVVIRREPSWQKPRALRVDLERVLSGDRLNYDIELRPFDLVYLPQTFIGNVGDFAVDFFDKVATPPFTTILRAQDAFRSRNTIVTRGE
ncbi:MAG: polysaccharide biosynthesis/export family protein [bacterium]